MKFEGEIKSFEELRRIVQGIDPDGRYFFRGEARDYHSLIPKVGRLTKPSKLSIGYYDEKSVFARFKHQAAALLNQLPRTDWEWLAWLNTTVFPPVF